MMAYRTLVIDPPWPQKGGGPLKGGHGEGFVGTAGSQPMPYRTMPVAEIAALRVADLADPVGCHLYLWTTNRFLRDAFEVVEAWGFTFSTVLTWAKKPMGGGLGGAYGISSEYVLFARRGALVEQVSPGPRLEMFARRERPGWDAWGDQAPGSVELPVAGEAVA